ncbi:MAG: hypothetical protein E7773_13575, partial [Sphingomonas sp.]|uniref:hypothetical protein n=1 Tax=Sphingomonas sp. TaxID=28214 RepID=UPI0012010CEB
MRWLLMTMLALGIALQWPMAAPAADNSLQSFSVMVGDARRDYLLFAPPDRAPMPLVIALHGGGGNGAQ